MSLTLSGVASGLVALLVVGGVLYKLFVVDDSPRKNVVVVTRELGLAGRVTGYNKARGYKIYLDSSDVAYNFDAFQNAAVAPGEGLGYYLERGDSVAKTPNSGSIGVTRQGQLSEWRLPPAPAPARRP